MGYHVVDPRDLPRSPEHPCDRRSITEAVGLGTLALAEYELRPGEQLPTEYHSHEHREEAFVVLDGVLHVETPEGTYRVDAGEIFVIEPGNPHRAFAPEDADVPVRVVGVGAPLFDPARPYDPDAA